jgi:L-threonylcarbamoyladenylate synthase
MPTREVLGELRVASAASAGDPAAPRRAPGMTERHYAPRARLLLFDPEERGEAARTAALAAAAGQRLGGLLLAPLDAPLRHLVRMPADPMAYATRLYAMLHQLDEAGCDIVLVEAVPDTPAWAGVRDRLRRASA